MSELATYLSMAELKRPHAVDVPAADITEDVIKNLYRLTPAGFRHPDAAYRTEPLEGISYPVAAPEDISFRMNQLTSQMRSCRMMMHPIELAALVLVRFLEISPFIEGNDDAAQLLMNAILIQCSYPTVTITPDRRPAFETTFAAYRDSKDMEAMSTLVARWVVEAGQKFSINPDGCSLN